MHNPTPARYERGSAMAFRHALGDPRWMVAPLQACESPIEGWFLQGIVEECCEREQTARVGLNSSGGVCYVTPAFDSPELLCILPQWPVNGWRIDFVVFMTLDHKAAEPVILVECDGHAYHERTKDQAARDRSRDRMLQADGYTVFRFTGRELYRDARGCASECVDYLLNRRSA